MPPFSLHCALAQDRSAECSPPDTPGCSTMSGLLQHAAFSFKAADSVTANYQLSSTTTVLHVKFRLVCKRIGFEVWWNPPVQCGHNRTSREQSRNSRWKLPGNGQKDDLGGDYAHRHWFKQGFSLSYLCPREKQKMMSNTDDDAKKTGGETLVSTVWHQKRR